MLSDMLQEKLIVLGLHGKVLLAEGLQESLL